MKPKLVEYVIPTKPVEKIIIKSKPINYISIFFNIFCILFVCIGMYVLYIRKENKEKNKEQYIKKVNNLYNHVYNKI